MEEDYYLLGDLADDPFEDDDDDDVGYEDELGVPRRRFRGRRSVRARTRNRRIAAKRNLARAIIPKIPGTPAAGGREWPLGFGAFQFVNAGATTATLTANPQRAFQGQRLVVVVARGGGAVSLVTITSLQVGSLNQLVSAQALPAEGFAPGSFQTVLDLDPATPGIEITLNLAVSPPLAVGETIDVSAMLIGTSIG